MLHPARKHVFDPQPLSFAQLVSTRHCPSATNQRKLAKSICRYALGLAYACGTYLSLRLSRRIVTVIDTLSHAAHRIGMGDFSVRIPVIGEAQLGSLVASFNEMTSHLERLREQEGYRVALERDIALAREVQQYLYPRSAPALSGATVWGLTRPARIVSGDLYDFFSFNNNEVGLLCVDVSGKGMSAALMMAHLQASPMVGCLPWINQASDHRLPLLLRCSIVISADALATTDTPPCFLRRI